jgi:hypothetical protein
MLDRLEVKCRGPDELPRLSVPERRLSRHSSANRKKRFFHRLVMKILRHERRGQKKD